MAAPRGNTFSPGRPPDMYVQVETILAAVERLKKRAVMEAMVPLLQGEKPNRRVRRKIYRIEEQVKDLEQLLGHAEAAKPERRTIGADPREQRLMSIGSRLDRLVDEGSEQ